MIVYVRRKYKTATLFAVSLIITYSVYVLLYSIGLHRGIIDVRILGNSVGTDSAYCFILMSLSLLLLVLYNGKRSHLLSRLFAFSVFSWSLIALARNFTLLQVPFGYGMSPITSFCFILLSVAFYFVKIKKLRYVTQGLLHCVTLISSVVLIGHLLNIPEFYRMSFIPMAMYSAIGFLMLSISASFINRTIGITGLFTGKLMGNIMARRLFLKLLVAVLAIGYLRLTSHRRGWLSPELGIACITLAFLIISLLLIWKTSSRLNTIHLKKKMAEENFRTAVAVAPYALVISDIAGTIIMANKQTKALYGYKKGQLIGKNVKMLIPEKLHEDYYNVRKNFFASSSVVKFDGDDELFAKRKDNTEFPVELILTPVNTSTGTFVLATIIDLTAQKHHEEIIAKQVTQLQSKNLELEQFNYISSHDLQEPLRTLGNYINLLEEDYSDHINEEMKMHLQAMGSSIGRMSCVVRSLLEFGKLGKNKKLSLTNCNTIVADVVADLGSLIKRTGASITTEIELPEFYAYETELRQLFQNLINNALKFNRDGIAPNIKIICKNKKGFYKFAIEDNGIGIHPGDCEKIFHIFHRLDNNNKYEGHGIGLANCKKIVEMHGGQIWVESEPERGSTFKFTIINFKA